MNGLVVGIGWSAVAVVLTLIFSILWKLDRIGDGDETLMMLWYGAAVAWPVIVPAFLIGFLVYLVGKFLFHDLARWIVDAIERAQASKEMKEESRSPNRAPAEKCAACGRFKP